jgi:hypothetical protein
MGEMLVATLGALNDELLIPCPDDDLVVVDVTGLGGTHTLTMTASVDGVTFRSVNIMNLSSSGGMTTTGALSAGAANASYVVPCAAFKVVRAKITAYTSGSCVVVASAGSGGGSIPYVSVVNQPTLSSNMVASASQTSPFLRHRLISAASQNPTVVKAASGNLHYLYAANDGGTKCFLKLYDKVSAPVFGDTPVGTYLLPPGVPQIITEDPMLRHPFASGIGYRITGLIADSDVTDIGLAQVALQALYI